MRVSYFLAQVIPAVHPGLEDGRVRRKSHGQPDDIKKPHSQSDPSIRNAVFKKLI